MKATVGLGLVMLLSLASLATSCTEPESNSLLQFLAGFSQDSGLLKDRKRRLKRVNGSRKFSRNIFGRCSKITSKHKRVLETKILKPTGDEST
jgi:hypothetical protein